MEHHFQRPQVIDYFGQWAEDPELSSAYAEATGNAS